MYHPCIRFCMTNPKSEMTSLCVAGNAALRICCCGATPTVRSSAAVEPDSTLSAAAGSYMEVDRDNVGTLTAPGPPIPGGRQRVNLLPEDVLHIPGLGFDRIMGYSPIVHERMPSVWDSPPKNLNKLGSTYARDVVCTALPISCRLASSSCPCPALPYLWPVSRQ